MGQKNHWLLYPTHLDFSSGAIVTDQVSFSLPTPYNVENSIYSEGGDLLVYFQNGELIDPANPPSGTPGNFVTTKETGIFPLPGTCNSYCAISLNPGPLVDLNLWMEEFEITGSGIQNLGSGFYVEGNGVYNFLGNTGGIAISKIIPGTDNNRNIYIISSSGVHIFLIDATGFHRVDFIPAQSFTFNNEPLDFEEIAEAELSPDGKWLAWNVDNYAIAMKLENYLIFRVLELQQRDASDYIKGLEFSAASDYLYISMRHRGVKKWDYTSPQQSGAWISGSWWLDNTQLELGKDGNIYGVEYMEYNPGNDGELQRIKPDDSIEGTGITVFSDGSQYTLQSGFALPDQIDGEDELLFHGVQPIELPPLSFNGTTLPSVVSGNVPEFYNCQPIILDNWGNGDIDDYDISITSVDPGTGSPIYGNGYLDYQWSFSEQPDADIRCLSKNCSFFKKYLGQTFKIVYTVGNSCDAHTEEGFFQVFAGPTPANTTLGVNIGNGNICPAAQTIGAVCPVILYGASIDLSQSQGDIDYYQLTFTEVDCMTGNPSGEGVFYEGPQVPVGNIGTINALSFNAIEIDGIMLYFIMHHYQDRCIRIDATVGNECGGTSKHAYIKFLISGFLSRPDLVDGRDVWIGKMGTSPTADDIATYPNPVSDKWMISWSNVERQTSDLMLYDQMGKVVYQKSMSGRAPHYFEEIDMSDFTAGLYYYQLLVGNEMVSGKVIKL